MRNHIAAFEAEYRRCKALGEGAIAQLDEAELSGPGPNGGNSIAIIVWHVAGNLSSRFIDFLTTDGEKEWRHREDEFAKRTVSRPDLMRKWNDGFDALFGALATLNDNDLARDVVIRGQSLRVDEALCRSLAHTSYHVGQIVYLAKIIRGGAWNWLTLPPGQSASYNQNPTFDKPSVHTELLSQTRPKQPS